MPEYVHPDEIRSKFSSAMSDMYRAEVPLYGDLIDLVQEINAKTLQADPVEHQRLAAADELERLGVERHGAIRLGTAEELFNIRRMFAVMGMRPVGYYDLSVAGLPVHSTAFRPVNPASLARNPFRVFTSLIRLELLDDRQLAATAEEILKARQIITSEGLNLIALAEANGGLTATEASAFVEQALETFRWHSEATVDAATYDRLHHAHRLIADVVSFKGPHINHLTPRTLDIDAVQREMPRRGITPKAVVEGPPSRQNAILLRQTSFKALEENIHFKGAGNGSDQVIGTHTARFGEIEQRGVALTEEGRRLYDRCLAAARAEVKIGADGEGADAYMVALNRNFADFPDTLEALRNARLAYFRYRAVTEAPVPGTYETIEDLIAAGHLEADPQIYEDFLPVSAAGIFQSNLGSDEQSNYSQTSNQAAFEVALGDRVADEMALYAAAERESLSDALTVLGQTHLLN